MISCFFYEIILFHEIMLFSEFMTNDENFSWHPMNLQSWKNNKNNFQTSMPAAFVLLSKIFLKKLNSLRSIYALFWCFLKTWFLKDLGHPNTLPQILHGHVTLWLYLMCLPKVAWWENTLEHCWHGYSILSNKRRPSNKRVGPTLP